MLWKGQAVASIKVAAYQMLVGPDPVANFARIRRGVEQAAEEGAKIIALPECALSGYPPLHHDSPDQVDTAAIAELNDEVCSLAQTNNIWVVLGTILMSSEGLLNSALVISPDGEIAGRYDKLHLMPEDRQFFAPGVGERVFVTDDGVIFVSIDDNEVHWLRGLMDEVFGEDKA